MHTADIAGTISYISIPASASAIDAHAITTAKSPGTPRSTTEIENYKQANQSQEERGGKHQFCSRLKLMRKKTRGNELGRECS